VWGLAAVMVAVEFVTLWAPLSLQCVRLAVFVEGSIGVSISTPGEWVWILRVLTHTSETDATTQHPR
jgi:hypothetical protein